MSSRFFGFMAAALVAVAAPACAPEEPTPPVPEVRLFDGLGGHRHAITTSSPLAQRYFDQGLVLTFGFNHAQAIRAFREAARQDPRCAMCFWGVALALGPNINLPMVPEAVPHAVDAAREAQRLAPAATPAERLYIDALAKRYSTASDAKQADLDRAYADAMREVAKQLPDDNDAATLFAESLMDLSPWDYWTRSGEPKAPTTLELVSTLETVLKRDPSHPGANHLYIHAVEASKTPERAEASADRLAVLVEDSGHLVHMPTHIYLRVGRYHDAAELNDRAASVDEEYLSWCRSGGFYPAAYYTHNVHFRWAAATMEGRSEVAIAAARKLVTKTSPEMYRKWPPLEVLAPTPWLALARFAQWDALLAEPAPPAEFRFSTGMWHYARGLALARTGRTDEAAAEHAEVAKLAADPALAELFLGAGMAGQLLGVAESMLGADIAGARGNAAERLRLLEQAVARYDALPYYEPEGWDHPPRLVLGAALLEAGRAADAERVYRADLEQHRENGWALVGLAQALEAQDKTEDASATRARFEAAWKDADVELSSSRL
jgi:hypothetical protein